MVHHRSSENSSKLLSAKLFSIRKRGRSFLQRRMLIRFQVRREGPSLITSVKVRSPMKSWMVNLEISRLLNIHFRTAMMRTEMYNKLSSELIHDQIQLSWFQRNDKVKLEAQTRHCQGSLTSIWSQTHNQNTSHHHKWFSSKWIRKSKVTITASLVPQIKKVHIILKVRNFMTRSSSVTSNHWIVPSHPRKNPMRRIYLRSWNKRKKSTFSNKQRTIEIPKMNLQTSKDYKPCSKVLMKRTFRRYKRCYHRTQIWKRQMMKRNRKRNSYKYWTNKYRIDGSTFKNAAR